TDVRPSFQTDLTASRVGCAALRASCCKNQHKVSLHCSSAARSIAMHGRLARILFRSTAAAVLLASTFAATSLVAATLDLERATIADLNSALKAGALTSEKLVSMYLT